MYSPRDQVLKEYEKTISELIADKERDKKALEAEVGQCPGTHTYLCVIFEESVKPLSGGKNAAGEGSGSGRPSGEDFHIQKAVKRKSKYDDHLLFYYVQNVEAAFADVHRKYERTKQVFLDITFKLPMNL